MIWKALLAGMRRTNRMPGLVIALFLFNVAVTLPMAAVMSRLLAGSIGASLVHENLRTGFDMDWYGEFQAGRTDMGSTFSPTIIGSGALMNNIETLFDGSFFRKYIGIVGLGLLYILAWTFFTGGIIDACQNSATASRERFALVAALYFPRFIQLLTIAAILYYAVYRFVSAPLFRGLEEWSRNWTSERPIFFLTMVIYAFVFFLLTIINIVFDYAKIHAVLEDRKNMLAAMMQGLLFVFRHPAQAFGLYYLVGAIAVLVMLVYGFLAPGPAQSSISAVVLAFGVGQAYILARIWAKLVFFASQTAMMDAYRTPLPETGSVIAGQT